MKNNWIIIILVAVLLLIALTGCGSQSRENELDESEPAANPASQEEATTASEPNHAKETETNPVLTHTTETEPQSVGFRVIDYQNPYWYVNAHIEDLDGDWPILYLTHLSSKEAIEDCAHSYFSSLFSGTAVTDVTLNCFEQISYIQSDTMEWIHEKVARITAESGDIPGYEHLTDSYTQFYQAVTDYEVDWYQLAIDCCSESGVRPWIYLRMNDHHYNTDPNSPYHERFYETAKENGWLIGKEEIYGPWIANAYDYSNQEVRNWMLDYIREVTSKYDVFGLQLDFMRQIYCFDYLNEPDKTEIMNGFIRDTRSILNEAERIHGHPMKLMIRLGVNVEHDLVFGFDVAEWVNEGLIDAVVPSPHYSTDSGIPVEEWRKAVGNDIAVFVGFENSTLHSGVRLPVTEAQVRGWASGYLARGADGLYFNNMYPGGERAKVWPLSLKNASDDARTYLVTEQDVVPIGEKGYAPLPFQVDPDGADIDLPVGIVREKEHVYLTVSYRMLGDASSNVTVTIDGAEPTEIKEMKIASGSQASYYLDENNEQQKADFIIRYCFENVPTDLILSIHFQTESGACFVEYLEAAIK